MKTNELSIFTIKTVYGDEISLSIQNRKTEKVISMVSDHCGSSLTLDQAAELRDTLTILINELVE